jgi:predicted helicase
MFLGGILAALALLLAPAARAFLRMYMNYEVASANQRFVAEIDYAQDRNDPRVRVHEIREDKRIFKWEAKLFIPIAETIHLADDGESIVLENYYPYTDQVLYFFHNGKEVRRYALKEVLPAADVEDMFAFSGLPSKGAEKGR